VLFPDINLCYQFEATEMAGSVRCYVVKLFPQKSLTESLSQRSPRVHNASIPGGSSPAR